MNNTSELERVFKIICEKRVNFRWINFSLEFYNKCCDAEWKLTEEEYELIQKYYNIYK